MRAADLFKESINTYQQRIKPPYKGHRDYLTLAVTLFLLIAVPVTVITVLQSRDTGSRAAGETRAHRVARITQQLKTEVANLKKNPSLRASVVTQFADLAKQRKADLKSLFASDPKTAAKMVLSDDALTSLRDFPQLPIEKKITLEGTFKPPQKNSLSPQIASSSGAFDLYSNLPLPSLTKGRPIQITGYLLDSKILVVAKPLNDMDSTFKIGATKGNKIK